MKKQYKRGDIHPETKKVFWCYIRSRNSKEYWCTPEAYQKRLSKDKVLRNSPKYKESIRNYSQKWYLENREQVIKKTTEYQKLRVKLKPFTFLWYNATRSTKHRLNGIEMDITPEYIQELWDKQDGKCYYTGVKMIYQVHTRSPFQPSLDRIDNSKGYMKGNVALCCQAVNYAKNDYNFNEFLEFITLIKPITSKKLINEIQELER